MKVVSASNVKVRIRFHLLHVECWTLWELIDIARITSDNVDNGDERFYKWLIPNGMLIL